MYTILILLHHRGTRASYTHGCDCSYYVSPDSACSACVCLHDEAAHLELWVGGLSNLAPHIRIFNSFSVVQVFEQSLEFCAYDAQL